MNLEVVGARSYHCEPLEVTQAEWHAQRLPHHRRHLVWCWDRCCVVGVVGGL